MPPAPSPEAVEADRAGARLEALELRQAALPRLLSEAFQAGEGRDLADLIGELNRLPGEIAEAKEAARVARLRVAPAGLAA